MRRVMQVLAGAGACAVIAACATDPATNVTATTATLNGTGQTKASPTAYFFQYANAAADLGTSAGRVTPTAATLPGGNVTGTYSAAVTGLTPARDYVYRACGTTDGATQCYGTRTFLTPCVAGAACATRDRVRVLTTPKDVPGQFENIDVTASSTPAGADPQGTVSLDVSVENHFEGPVTCLGVTGSTAVVGFASALGARHLFFTDNGGGGADTLEPGIDTNRTGTDCSPKRAADTAFGFGVLKLDGRASIFDAAPTATATAPTRRASAAPTRAEAARVW